MAVLTDVGVEVTGAALMASAEYSLATSAKFSLQKEGWIVAGEGMNGIDCWMLSA